MTDPLAAAMASSTPSANATTATPTTAPAATTAAPTAPSDAAPAAPVADWTSGLNDELKGYVGNKGFKDPSAVIDSYRNLEKLLGVPQDQILRIPKGDDAEAWSKVYEKLGRPATADEYKLEGVHEEFASWAKTAYHELGLTKAQAEKLTAKMSEYGQSAQAKMNELSQAKLGEQQTALKKEWGLAFDQNLSVAKRAAQAFGATPEAIDALEKVMGFDGVMKFMHGLGAKLGEDSFHSGGRGNSGFGALTPEAARNRIEALKGDPTFVQRYVAGAVDARDEMAKLHKWAYPEG